MMAAKSKIYGVTADHLPIKSNCIGPDMTKGADKRLVRADGSVKRANHVERGVR